MPWVNNGGGCSSSAQCLSGNCWASYECCNTACNNTTCDTVLRRRLLGLLRSRYETTSCGNAYWLGADSSTPTLYATIQNAADAEDWYYLYATDGDNACFWPIYDFGHLIATLDIPSTVDYDLYLYKWHTSCSDLELKGSSVNGTGAEDRVDFQEDCGADDSAYYFAWCASPASAVPPLHQRPPDIQSFIWVMRTPISPSTSTSSPRATTRPPTVRSTGPASGRPTGMTVPARSSSSSRPLMVTRPSSHTTSTGSSPSS